MTTLIVGCGYLGRRVARRLVDHGERVFGTTRSRERGKELVEIGVEPVVADVLDPASLDRLPEFDRVFYCVGFDRSAGRSMREIYVDGLRQFLERTGKEIRRLVYASSTGVYGQDDGSWVDETSVAEPSQDSGRVVLDAENEVRAWDPNSVILRYVGLYGPGRVIGRSKVERGEPLPGNPDRWLNLIHIEDAAAIAVAALTHTGPGLKPLYVAADDRPATAREYYGLLATHLGSAPPTFERAEIADEHGRNKRASNRLAKIDLGLELRYPDISTGVPAALASTA